MGDNKEKMSNSKMWLKIDSNLIFGKGQREKDVKEEESWKMYEDSSAADLGSSSRCLVAKLCPTLL